jgi:hypothetical protein
MISVPINFGVRQLELAYLAYSVESEFESMESTVVNARKPAPGGAHGIPHMVRGVRLYELADKKYTQPNVRGSDKSTGNICYSGNCIVLTEE